MERSIVILATLHLLVFDIPIVLQAQANRQPSFEVASVKPDTSGNIQLRVEPGGRFIAGYMPLRALISIAYNVRDFQILRAPSWIETDRWRVEARPEEGTIPAQMEGDDGFFRLMLQSLLEDRFQMKVHRETRELPVYELTIAKGGPKLALSENQGPILPNETSKPGTLARGSVRSGTGYYEAPGMKLEEFVKALSRFVGNLVINKTGLTSLYNIKLEWTPDMDPATESPTGINSTQQSMSPRSGPSIFTAIQEQLGLKLERTKGPVEVLIIDEVHKATEN